MGSVSQTVKGSEADPYTASKPFIGLCLIPNRGLLEKSAQASNGCNKTFAEFLYIPIFLLQ